MLLHGVHAVLKWRSCGAGYVVFFFCKLIDVYLIAKNTNNSKTVQ